MAINEQINLDITPFLDSLKKLSTEAAKVGASVRDVLNKTGTVKLGVEVESGDLTKIKEEIEGLTKETTIKVNADTEGLTIDKNGKVRNALGQFAKGFEVVNGQIVKTSTSLDNFGKKGGFFSGFNAQFDGLKNKFKEGQAAAAEGGGIFGDIASQIGGLATPAGLATAAMGALTTGLIGAFTVGKEYETNLKAVSAVTGITGDGLKLIGDAAKDLGTKFGTGASDNLKSFQGILSRFGADLAKTPEALKAVGENVNILAKAGGLEASAAMDTLTNSMLQFGVDVTNPNAVMQESARYINVLAASARVGAAEIPQVGEAVLVAGVEAKKANVSFEETNAAIQVLAAGGKVGAEAGTALRNVLGKIAGEEVIPKDALNKLKSLGVDMNKVSDTSTPLSERLKELSKASKDATAFTQVFGSENSAAAAILANGATTISQWTKEITGTKDAIKQAEINMATFQEIINRVTETVKTVGINVYEALIPVINNVIAAFSVLYKEVQPILENTFNQIGGIFQNLWDILKPIMAGIGAVIAVGWSTTVAVFTATVNILSKVVERIKNIFAPVFNSISKIFGDTGKSTITLSDIFQGFGKYITVLTDILVGVADVFFTLGDTLFQLGKTIVSVVISPFKFLGELIGAIVGYISSFVSGGEKATNTSKKLGAETEKTTGFFQKLVSVLLNIPNFIAGVSGALQSFTSILSEVGDVFLNVFENGIGGSVEKLLNIFSNAGSKIGDGFNKGWNKKAKERADEDKKQAAENAKAQIDAQNKELAKDKTAEKSKEKQESLLKILEERFNKEKEIVEIENQKNKLAIENLRIEQGQELSKQDKLDLAKKELENAENLAKEYEKIFKVVRDGDKIKIGVNLPKDEKLKVEKNYLSLLTDINNKKLGLNVNAVESKDFKKQLEEIAEKFGADLEINTNLRIKKDQLLQERDSAIANLEALKIQLKAELGINTDADVIEAIKESIKGIDEKIKGLLSTDVSLNVSPNFSLDEAQKAKDAFFAALNATESEIKAKLSISTDDKEKEGLRALLEQINKQRQDGDKKYLDFKKQFDEDKFNAELALIKDNTQREIAIKIRGLLKQRDEELKNTQLTEQGRKNIIARYQSEIDKLTQKSGSDYVSFLNDSFAQLGQTIGQAFAPATKEQQKLYDDAKKELDEVNEKHQERIAQIDAELAAIKDTTKTGGVLYNKNADKITQLEEEKKNAIIEYNKEIEESTKKLEENSIDSADRIRIAMAASFGNIRDIATQRLNEAAKNMGESLAKTGLDFNNLAAAGLAATTSILAGFGQLIAQGGATLGDFAKVAASTVIDTVQVALNAYAAQIFAVNAGALPFGLGIPAALGIIATMNGLLAIAKASLGGIGAEDGVVGIKKSYNKRKGVSDTIPLWVAPNETIIKAKESIKRMPLLEAINDGGSITDGIIKTLSNKELRELSSKLAPQNKSVNFNLEKNIVPVSVMQKNNDEEIIKMLKNFNIKLERDERINVGGKFRISGRDMEVLFAKEQKRKTRGY
ncbi:phage tail tape measure protein [Flavobacterium filum]|uniref:phage tail tape measure protein n=1 Tax=Flavobacterium filum TaxID=370974 RepID=UPI0023F00B63|nr:phage tail tape measure protein [Flavobacterium filum]